MKAMKQAAQKLVWHNEKRVVNDLLPYKYNPRILTEDQAERLRKSIEEFGYVETVVVNLDGVLVAGHQRCRILKMLNRGAEEIDVRVPNRTLTDDEVRRYNITSNKVTGSWDWDMLANHFDVEELQEIGFQPHELDFAAKDTPEDLGGREEDANPLADDAETFNNAAIKQIVLFYGSVEYETYIDKLNFLKEKLGKTSFTEVVNALVDKEMENHADFDASAQAS